MRSGAGIAALLIAISLPVAATPPKPCPEIAQYIARLQKGETPGEFPDPKDCAPYDTELGKALGAYISKRPPDVAQVVASIRDAHRRASRADVYAGVVAATYSDLAERGERLTTPSVQDPFALLDPVVAMFQPKPAAAPPPKPQPSPPSNEKSVYDLREVIQWLMVVGAVSSLSLIASAAHLAIVAFPRKPAKPKPDPAQAVIAGLTPVVDQIKTSAGKLDTSAMAISEAHKKFSESAHNSLLAMASILADAEKRRADAERQLLTERSSATNGEPQAGGGSVQLEREVLREAWRTFLKNEELTTLLAGVAKDEMWKKCEPLLLFQLQKYVPEDLKPTFDSVIAPARDFHNLIRKITLIPRVIDGQVPLASEAQELMRTRELAHLLVMTQSSNLIADRLTFRLRPWIADSFIGFADLYIQRYQEARIENKHAALEPGLRIVRSVLEVAEIEPVELSLGETPFDSTQHVGRSAANDPRFPEGVIVGVIRNGFIRSGQDVIRQPEVVVNRMR
jgi:hypothetical protein